jgi:hypothetical protein
MRAVSRFPATDFFALACLKKSRGEAATVFYSYRRSSPATDPYTLFPIPNPFRSKPNRSSDLTFSARTWGLHLPDSVDVAAPKLSHWAELLSSRRADSFKEQEILPDFLTDCFCGVLGYTRPADGQRRYTISREKHV